MVNSTEKYYQNLFEDTPIGIYRSTPDGKIINANKVMLRMLGYPDIESLMAVHVSDLFLRKEDYEKERKLLIKEGKVKSFEFQLRRKDGEIIYVRDTMHITRDKKGNALFYDGVLEDVTERVRAKKALVESRSRIEAERAQRQLAETLREVSNLISGSLEFEEVTQQIFQNLKHLLPLDSSSLILQKGDGYVIAAVEGFEYPKKLEFMRINLENDPLTQEIIQTQKPLLIHNATEDPRFRNYGEAKSVKSWLGVPLIARKRVIGILTLDSLISNVYRDREIQIAFTLASQIAVALENAALFEDERQRANIMAALQRTSADITAELDLQTLLDSILQRASNLLNADGGELALYDADEDMITIKVCHNMTEDFTGRKMRPGQGAIGQVVVSGEPLIISDYKTWEGHLRHAAAWPWIGVIVVPLKVRNRILGAIALTDSKIDRKFDQKDQRTLTLFAQQAAIAIENAQLFEQISSALTNTETLYQSSRALIATENLNDLLQNLVEQVASTLPADRVILITLDTQKEEITHYVIGGVRNMFLEHVSYQELMDGLTGWVMRECKPVLSHYKEADPREKPHVQKTREEFRCGSIIVVPLFYRQEIIGTLTAIHSLDSDYSQNDVGLLETIASHAAIAIKNAQLFEEIQELAKTDDLTGINNRRQLFNLGNNEFNRSRRYQHPFSVIMLDIDNFKKINDSYGHAVGDEVLRFLAQICQENIREIDILGRYGGEEFVILLPNTQLNQGISTADRLRVQVEKSQVNTSIGELCLTISLGVAEISKNTPNLAALIDQADTALYFAKEQGKNRVETCDGSRTTLNLAKPD